MLSYNEFILYEYLLLILMTYFFISSGRYVDKIKESDYLYINLGVGINICHVVACKKRKFISSMASISLLIMFFILYALESNSSIKVADKIINPIYQIETTLMFFFASLIFLYGFIIKTVDYVRSFESMFAEASSLFLFYVIIFMY